MIIPLLLHYTDGVAKAIVFQGIDISNNIQILCKYIINSL